MCTLRLFLVDVLETVRCRLTPLAELTLLIVIVVTVVPAVLLMVLGIVPEAPTELCQDNSSRISSVVCGNY